MRSRTKIRSCATILGLLYILLLDPAFVTTAPVSVEEGDFDVEGGCYYMLELYQNGEQIRTNEPCLNCTCSDNMLMCYLKTCPFTKPIGSDCVAKRIPGMCCPIIKCPEVPVMIPDAHHQVAGTTAVSVAHYQTTTALSVAKPEEGGCYSNEKYYGEGSQVPSSSTADPCDLCYCIQNHTACVKQRCVLEIPGCTPKYKEGVCCPVGYNCDSSVTFTSTSTTTTTTTTTLPSTGCWVDDEFYYDGSNIITGEACNHCYCLQGKVVCAVQECDPPVEWCQPVITHDSCCPFKYNCSSTIRPPLNASYDEAFSTTPEVQVDDDVVETSKPEILISDSTTALPTDDKSDVEEEKATTSAPVDESEHPSIATTENYSEDEIKLTTEQGIEPNVLLDERFKKPNVSIDVPHPTPAVLSDEIETDATSAAPKEEEIPVTTEQVVVAETTESFKEEVKIQSDEQPTVRPLESDSHRVEPEATTELLFETTETAEKIENVQAVEALKPVDSQTTQLPIKDLEFEKQPEATTNLNLDLDVVNPTTAAPESIDLEATTELLVKEAEGKEPEVHLTESKLSTKIPEIELATTEEHIPQETTATAVADDESKLDTTPAVVEDEESNLIEESVKPTAKPTHVIESKPETAATTALPVLPTTDLLPENRDELTEAPIAFTTEIAQNNPEEVEIFTTELPHSILLKEPAATTEALILNIETTALPVEVKEELTTPVALEHSGDDDDAISSDPIPGEGDCLQDGVTYSSGFAVPSNNLCSENCTCHNSIIKCDKIHCEKPASFRHLTCTEVFEDKHCCPRYVCESTSNRKGVLESDSLVTESSSDLENAEKETSAPLEQTTVFEEKLTTEKFLELEEKFSTFVPEAPVESEITTAVPVADDASEVDDHKNKQPIEPTTEEAEPQEIDDHKTNKPIELTTEVPVIEPVHDEQIATTEAVELKEPELTTFKEEATTVKEHKIEIIHTPKLEVIETTVAPLDDSPSLALTTEADKRESVDDDVTAADDIEKITSKPHDLSETKFAPTEKPLEQENEEDITTVGAEKIETEAPIVETEAPIVETEAPIVETEAPIVETEAPIVETEAPIVETEAPIVETEAPIVETEAPIVETKTPIVKTAAPHVPAETVAPIAEEVFATTEFLEISSPPPLKQEKPIADDQSPIHEEEHLQTTSAEVFIPEIEATTENIPAVETVTVIIPAVEVKTESVPAVEAKTESVPAVEAKTENVPAVEATTENVPAVEATTENIPAVEEKQAESTEKVVSIPQQNASVAHEVSFVTEENVQGDIQGEAHIAPSEKSTTSEKPLRENPTTRLSISVEVVTPEAIATTEVLPPAPVEEIKQVNLTKEAVEPPTEEPPKSFVQQDAKTEESPGESIEFTSPLSVTETLVEDDDPLQTVDIIPATSTLPPKIDDRINELVATTVLPVKHTTTSTTTTAKVEEKHTTPVFVQPELPVTTAIPEEIPAAVTTSKLIAESHIFEHAETTTAKDVTYVNVTTPAVELATEQHIREYTTTVLLQHPTTIPALVETVATTSVPVVITSHIPSKATTTITTTTEPTTSTTEKTTTVSSTLASTTTTTPIPSLSHHLPADEKEGVEDPHHSSHEVDYEDHTEGIFLPELGKPITAENFEIQDGQCVYESRLYESAQQIPRSDPCDFCFCFRGDIICLQQSCPPPIDGCYEETIPGFCCPRFECPVTAVTLNVSDAKVPYPISASRQRSARAVAQIQVVVCEFRNKFYRPGELIKAASSPCMDCQCAESGTMKCTPKKCQLDPFWHSLHGFKKTDKIDIKRAGRIRH